MGANYYLLKPSPVTRKRNYNIMFDSQSLFVHLFRSTNNIFIWAVNPNNLKAMEEAGCMPYFEDGSPVSWDHLYERINDTDISNDYEYVGTNTIFC